MATPKLKKLVSALTAGSTSVVNSRDTSVEIHNQTITIQSEFSDKEKDAQKLIMEGINVIKKDYNEKERKCKTFQWNDDLNLDLEVDYLSQMFTPIEKGQNLNRSKSISTSTLMGIFETQKGKKFLIEGDFSTGKSTMCRYILYKWTCGHLQCFSLVMMLSLRNLQGKTILEKLFETFIQISRVKVSFDDFETFILGEGEKIFLLLDGVDQMPKEEQEKAFHVLKGNDLVYATALATSRPMPIYFPLGCHRYVSQGISHTEVETFLNTKLDTEVTKRIVRLVSMDILRRPLLLKFVTILARSGECLTDIPTPYHVYYRLLLHLLKTFAEKNPDHCNAFNKAILEVAKDFIDQLGLIAFDCGNRNTFAINKGNLVADYKLQERDIENQRRIGILSFYTEFTNSGLDESEVCEFVLKSFAELLSVLYLNDLLMRGDPRVSDLSKVFRLSMMCHNECKTPSDNEVYITGFGTSQKEVLCYLFCLLDKNEEVCQKVFLYFLTHRTCRCRWEYGHIERHRGSCAFMEMLMNESLLAYILGVLTGNNQRKCCEHYLRECGKIRISIDRFANFDSPFMMGLLALMENSPKPIPIDFYSAQSLLAMALCYIEKHRPGMMNDHLRGCLQELKDMKNEFNHEDADYFLTKLHPHSRVLGILKKRLEVLTLDLNIGNRQCTPTVYSAIEWLKSTFGVQRVKAPVGFRKLSEMGNVSPEICFKENVDFSFIEDLYISFLDDNDIYSVFFENKETMVFQRCQLCIIGRCNYQTGSDAIAFGNETIPFEDISRETKIRLLALESSWKGYEQHGSLFAMSYECNDHMECNTFTCTCGDQFRLEDGGCRGVCACGRYGLVNEEGQYRVQLKCRGCGTSRNENCCDMDRKITCPHCDSDLEDTDFVSGALLKLTHEVVIGTYASTIYKVLDQFGSCPLCHLPTRQSIKCPKCRMDIVFDKGCDRGCRKMFFSVRCTLCQRWLMPGMYCQNSGCKYFGIGIISNSAIGYTTTTGRFLANHIVHVPRQ